MALATRLALRSLRNHRENRCWRNGRGVSSPRHEAGSRRGAEDSAGAVRERSRTARAVRARSENPRRAQSSPYRAYSRPRGSGPVRALVLEFVDGPTLADRIAQGSIAIDEALSIARQIADALEAAHDLGIIHRDLKPANIKLRADGTVKVLDFGLAKALDPTSRGAVDLGASPTITSPAPMTGVGVILGTLAYMSPEQARGQPVSKRTDIWAFGCVLFEMITSHRAFPGGTISDTIAAVLERSPDWTALPPPTPPTMRRVLARCLEKDEKLRWRDVGDVAHAARRR